MSVLSTSVQQQVEESLVKDGLLSSEQLEELKPEEEMVLIEKHLPRDSCELYLTDEEIYPMLVTRK